ncbi:uncharacterized protein LOC114471291 isoform X3 [Gouania willdenowi]|uniref:uncharacterized protein LOC114471291 isoform X3 n=1 Tax=Gouania willdenowi TaxID=441366 RepID=UPI0010568155|nr:uncharacterized protein LOC114471291 isoform X3 [Gouania willdenowi]
MSLRRFFRATRDEDFSQIQYLTAKCTRLARDKELDRECVLSREKQRMLQEELEAAASQIFHQTHQNMELRRNQDRLINRIRQQQELVELLHQRVVLLVEESCRDAELLRQVGSELLCVQNSEGKLEGLVEELHHEAQRRAAEAEGLQMKLHAEAQHRAALTESLLTELHGKTVELQKLQAMNRTLTDEMKDLRRSHHQEVMKLQQENKGSLKKLQQTAEQFEWLCQQQKHWMLCVKRFKDCLMEEREARVLEKKTLDDQRPSPSLHYRPLLDTQNSNSSVTSWDVDAVTKQECDDVKKSSMLYEEIFKQAGRPINGYRKPP